MLTPEVSLRPGPVGHSEAVVMVVHIQTWEVINCSRRLELYQTGKAILLSKLSFNPNLKGNEQTEVSGPHDADVVGHDGFQKVVSLTDLKWAPTSVFIGLSIKLNTRCPIYSWTGLG